MVGRVREFCRANPSDTPGYVQALEQLEERLGRAESLLTQQDTGVLTERGSTKGKAVLRKTIRENHLRHLVRIARGAATVNPELTSGSACRCSMRTARRSWPLPGRCWNRPR